MTPMPRKRGPPTALRIDTPVQNPHIALALGDSSASALSSATSESDYSPFAQPHKVRSLRNMKKLSLTLPSAQSSSNSLHIPSEPQSAVSTHQPELPRVERPRRPSIISLPSTSNTTATTSALLHRKEEEGEPAVPYADGPTQIIPGIWLGSEDNARDWKGLIERGIKSILNVAKEVSSPFDSVTAQSLRACASTPNLKLSRESNSTFYPAHPATGRPSMHYLKLQWSHGQQDLVEEGFPSAMSFIDASIERGEGVLIHCQCGISRSATMVIALVMRAAAERSSSVPPEVWALPGMQGAYSFVKEKSKWVGPNMSLIYQLLEYEKKLKGGTLSPSGSEKSSVADEEEEWGRRRRMMDEAPSSNEDERESTLIMREAQALDKAMEERMVARKNSAGSVTSNGSGVGMGPAWRSRYSHRKRAGSVASNMTNGSILSEDLVEEEEEQELLGIGGGFDDERGRCSSAELDESSATNSPDDEVEDPSERNVITMPLTPRAPPMLRAPPKLRAPPSAPVWKSSFKLPPPPATATRSTFDLPPPPPSAMRSTFDLPARPSSSKRSTFDLPAPLSSGMRSTFESPLRSAPKGKRRPPPIALLPTVPSSPNALVLEAAPSTKQSPARNTCLSLPPTRKRAESRKPAPPPLHLRGNLLKKVGTPLPSASATPSQTLFFFPPSPTTNTRTPSTMTLTSNMNTPLPFPSLSTPRVSTFRTQGRTRSFIGLGAPPTPTTGFSKVDARGYVGLE